MNKKETVTLYYKNAREQIKLGEPKKARVYVVAILNIALEEYKSSKTIISKVKNEAFLERWIAVSRDLYDFGITDYVLECFGLDNKKVKAQTPSAPKTAPEKVPAKNPSKAAVKKQPKPELTEPLLPEPAADGSSDPDGEIDITGIMEDVNSQGWGADIFEANKTAVVQIEAYNTCEGSSGTGFIISDKGYLLTNDHVVFNENNCVYYKNVRMSLLGTKKSYKVEVLFSDKRADLALCQFNPEEVEGFSSVKMIADYSRVKPGADCLIIGNAFGMGLAPCMGIIRFIKNDKGNLVYTIPSNPGDSGSPVFNHGGEVIGINKSKTLAVNGEAADGYANATPMDEIRRLLDKWTSNNGIIL